MEDQAAQQERTVHTLDAYPAASPEVGVWLGAMQTVRGGLLRSLGRIERAGFGQEFLDWRGPAGDDNSVGTVLHHIASVELGWLYFDIMLGDTPDDLEQLLPFTGWDDQGMLTHVPGRTISEHLELLAEARRRFLDLIGPMTLADWRSIRSPDGEDYSATPEWVVYHLVEHEAGHMYEIHRMVRKWRARSAEA